VLTECIQTNQRRKNIKHGQFRIAGRVRTDHAQANFTTIKHMAHNLLRPAASKDSLRLRRKVAAWDDDFLTRIITR
jgi:hypothetical protein